MSPGYSGKPLAEKLGIKPGMVVNTVAAPGDYAALVDPLPESAGIKHYKSAKALISKQSRAAEFIHCFFTTRVQLEEVAAELASLLAPGGTLWISWPKLTAAKKLGLPGDINEQTLRDLLLPAGLVDVKVCAVSEVWSGLKFMWRKNS